MRLSHGSILLSTVTFTLALLLYPKEIQAQNRQRNNYGLGMDLIWYCKYRHGASARLVLRENNAYGWKCEVNGRDLGINTVDVCQSIYGENFKPWIGNFEDSHSWYCKEESVDSGSISGLPVSGTRVPKLNQFDQVMTQFMREHNIKAGTLSISRNTQRGQARVIFSRGYGYQDRQLRSAISPNALMRVASVDKPITNAAIKLLIRQGRLSPNTRVFPLLGITKVADRRFNEITVKNLQDHRWWEGVHHYPHNNLIEVAQMLGVPSPPSTLDIARYIAMRPLQYAPGSQGDYCGFCYDLLREVVEKVSGKPIVEFLRADLGMRDVARAYALPGDREPREIWYSDPGQCRNLYNPRSRNPVPCPDGGFAVWRTTFITSSPSLADFFSRYWINGDLRSPGDIGAVYTFFGSWPGTFTMVHQRSDGINIAVLFNQRTDSSGVDYAKVKDRLDEVADRIRSWP